MSARARFVLVLGLLAVSVSPLLADEPKKEIPKPLPKEVVAAWEKAGAEVGWMYAEPFGSLHFRSMKTQPKVDWVPAFQIQPRVWKEGILKGLPLPEGAYGLDLNLTFVADEDLKELVGLKQLTHLSLHDTKVTDEGLKRLAAFEKLSHLDLVFTKVTDEGLKELANVKQLTHLSLAFTEVTDKGLKEITSLKQLTSLYLTGTAVTDAGAKELANAKQLTQLGLRGTKVTDAALKELASLKQLSWLDLVNTKVTAEGVKGIQQALPKCKIIDLVTK